MSFSRKTELELSETTALEVLAFHSKHSNNVQYSSSKDELMINGLGFREQMLVKASLIALGADKGKFLSSDSDEGTVTLSCVFPIAKKLADAGVNFVGRGDIPSTKTP